MTAAAAAPLTPTTRRKACERVGSMREPTVVTMMDGAAAFEQFQTARREYRAEQQRTADLAALATHTAVAVVRSIVPRILSRGTVRAKRSASRRASASTSARAASADPPPPDPASISLVWGRPST